MTDAVYETVISYMRTQNRPYSGQNVFDNIRGEVAKSKVMQALEIFCLKQLCVGETSNTDARLIFLRGSLEEKKEELRSLRCSFDSLSVKLSFLESHAGACEREKFLIDRLAGLHQQINTIEAECGTSKRKQIELNDCPEELEGRIESLSCIASKRRKIANIMMGEICEQGGFSRNQLAGDLGLEILDVHAIRSRDA